MDSFMFDEALPIQTFESRNGCTSRQYPFGHSVWAED